MDDIVGFVSMKYRVRIVTNNGIGGIAKQANRDEDQPNNEGCCFWIHSMLLEMKETELPQFYYNSPADNPHPCPGSFQPLRVSNL